MGSNLEIYNNNYSKNNYILNPSNLYDKKLTELRFKLIQQYGYGKDVLDLCCGSGAYLIPVLDKVKSAIGVDFSQKILDSFIENLGNNSPGNLKLVNEDATHISLPDNSFDFIFSYCSLYTIPDVILAIREISRLLRHEGYAALELGNLYSLNTLVCNIRYIKNGWAKPYYIPFKKMREYLKKSGLKIVEWHPFQVLPMLKVPFRLIYLYPLLTPLWKLIMGISIKGKMLDELISRIWPFKYFAFRHIFIVKKDEEY